MSKGLLVICVWLEFEPIWTINCLHVALGSDDQASLTAWTEVSLVLGWFNWSADHIMKLNHLALYPVSLMIEMSDGYLKGSLFNHVLLTLNTACLLLLHLPYHYSFIHSSIHPPRPPPSFHHSCLLIIISIRPRRSTCRTWQRNKWRILIG